MKDIYYTFKKASLECHGGGDNVFKLSLLLIFFICLLMRNGTSKRIELQYLHIVDDLELFNRFPWRFLAYESIVIAAHNYKALIDQKVVQGENPTFDAYGFIHLIQVFAYEVHTNLGLHCTKWLYHPDVQFPRMRRWRVRRFFRYKEIEPYFINSNKFSMVMCLCLYSWKRL